MEKIIKKIKKNWTWYHSCKFWIFMEGFAQATSLVAIYIVITDPELRLGALGFVILAESIKRIINRYLNKTLNKYIL